MKDFEFAVSIDLGEAITVEMLDFHINVLRANVARLSNLKKLERYQHEDLQHDRVTLLAMERVRSYFSVAR